MMHYKRQIVTSILFLEIYLTIQRLVCCTAFTVLSKPYTTNRNNDHPIPSTRLNDSNFGGGEITALARIDREFQLTTRSSNRPTGGEAGWTKLQLDSDKNDESQPGEDTQAGTNEDFVYLLEPNTSPSCLILFLGGAGLGQYPHIAYNELLSRISKRLNAAIITAPYPLGLDHFELSKKSGEKLRRAVVQCEENGGYSEMLPKFYLGHSLGSKLLTITLAATAASGMAEDVSGIGFLNFNNFGFADTIGMVKSFSGSIGGGTGASGGMGPYSQLFDFAEQAVSMSGVDFSPNPTETNKIISLKYDEELQRKTRLFVFDQDDLDSSQSFIESCNGSGPSISKVNGNHLATVYLKLGLNDLDIPTEAKMFTDEITGGFQSASFGNEKDLNEAVDNVCNWLVGKETPLIESAS